MKWLIIWWFCFFIAVAPVDLRATTLNTPTPAGPWISFTEVSEYGDPNGYASGEVGNVAYHDYQVEVYIKVGDSWWTKPYDYAPFSDVNDSTGTWDCDIVTYSTDKFATEIAAFLVPIDTSANLCLPCYNMPSIPGAPYAWFDRNASPRYISFAGYDWLVKRGDVPIGPGPNRFSVLPEDVWVDPDGNLHLTINQSGGYWWCTEVINTSSLGYGTYIIQTRSRVDIIDPNMVVGLFTWDTGSPETSYREMDIEFARWGDPSNATNAQYAVQPCSSCPGCEDRCHRFQVDLTEAVKDLTNYLIWQQGSVTFKSYLGAHLGHEPPSEDLITEWTYTGPYTKVPGAENFRINFWLLNGLAPISGVGAELIVTGFACQDCAPTPTPLPALSATSTGGLLLTIIGLSILVLVTKRSI